MTTPTNNSDMPALKKALVIGVGAEKGLGASISARFAREGSLTNHTFAFTVSVW